MSVLKRFLTNDLPAMLGRGDRTASGDSIDPKGSAVPAIQGVTGAATPPAGTRSGLRVVILNWKSGENDPFSVANAALRAHFHACGKLVETIEISDPDWPPRFAAVAADGVEFASTWQGLGSAVEVGGERVNLWEHVRVPLMCIHGDHPSHMPPNHQSESRYCFHLYNNAEFARYSNQHFRRQRGASLIDIPQLHHESRLSHRAGDYFVFAKNLDDPAVTESRWRDGYGTAVADMYLAAAEAVRSRIASEPYVDIHDALDAVIVEQRLEPLRAAVSLDAHHQYHRELDFYLRAHKSIAVVAALRDFPVCVYGRGWERIAHNAPVHHRFEPGRNMADSQAMYYSRFGIVDVSPSKGLHDRTRRAMVNGTGFLSSANLEDSFVDFARFDRLFYSFRPGELADKCAAVMHDPEAHHEAAQAFADRYHDKFHFRLFVERLDTLAKSVRMAAWEA